MNSKANNSIAENSAGQSDQPRQYIRLSRSSNSHHIKMHVGVRMHFDDDPASNELKFYNGSHSKF